MRALDQVALPAALMLLRFPLRRDRRMLVPDASRRRRQHHSLSVLRLVSHLVTTSLVFLALMTLVWTLSLIFHLMHSVHPFPDEAFQLLDRLKILLVYGDVAVSGVVLLNGIWHYIAEVIRGDS